MAWTTTGDGITTSDGSGGVLTTSTSTVLALNDAGETILPRPSTMGSTSW